MFAYANYSIIPMLSSLHHQSFCFLVFL